MKDEMLFREVVDKSQALFYARPEEHRHFAFITNKYYPVELQQIIKLEDLRKQTDLSNKILVSPSDHYQLNNWWKKTMRNIQRVE